jgi:hypothetical protein
VTRFTLGVLITVTMVGSAAAQTPSGGGWRGEWVSETTGHRGPLAASVKPLANGDVRVRYWGRFLKVVPFTYAVTMHRTGTGEAGEVFLTNTSKLMFFGSFTADAVLTEHSFESRYNSKKDRGRFSLRR